MTNIVQIFNFMGDTSLLYTFTCNFSAFLDNLLLTARMWTLAASSIDRFILICHSVRKLSIFDTVSAVSPIFPYNTDYSWLIIALTEIYIKHFLISLTLISSITPLQGRYRDIISKRRLRLVLGMVWTIAVIAAVPPLLGWSKFGYSELSFNCGIVVSACLDYACGYLVSWKPGSSGENAFFRGASFLETLLPGYLVAWIPGCLETLLPGNLVSWIPCSLKRHILARRFCCCFGIF